MMMVNADGKEMGLYRKTHLPQGPGYEEKFYFNPGNLGFRVWDTAFGRIGVAICWDQWFPEAARIMALKGADILLYPTAIGSEPGDPSLDSSGHWQRTMQGHAAANMVTLAASNRIGKETVGAIDMTFYGQSFIANHTGALVAECHDGINLLQQRILIWMPCAPNVRVGGYSGTDDPNIIRIFYPYPKRRLYPADYIPFLACFFRHDTKPVMGNICRRHCGDIRMIIGW